MRRSGELLIAAGEPSGDALGARVVTELAARTFGIGGAELRAAGTDLVADLSRVAAMGLRAPLGSAPAVVHAVLALARAIEHRRPQAALLVGFSEVNARLAPWLRRRGVHVVWCAPPQVWAWRPGRAVRIAGSVERLAVLLPFETEVWRRAGGRAEYVGHPALDRVPSPERPRAQSERRLIALLPGSRRQEVFAHLPAMLGAAKILGASTGAAARIVLSPALPEAPKRWVQRMAAEHGVTISSDSIEVALAAAQAAVVSSGTATLECATLGVPPVIVYRTDRLTHLVAKRLLCVQSIGLPNLVLGRPVFPELVQDALTPDRVASALHEILNDPGHYKAACEETRATLSAGLGAGTAAARVARIVEPWLA